MSIKHADIDLHYQQKYFSFNDRVKKKLQHDKFFLWFKAVQKACENQSIQTSL